VHTAATAAVAQAYADSQIGEGDSTDFGEKADTFTADNLQVEIEIGDETVVLNLVTGLGTEFKGQAAFWYDPNSYSITAAAWSSTASIPDEYPVDGRDKNEAIIGWYPIPTDITDQASGN
ncbi:MAG: hypothetical protein K2J76_09445, partial [Oscillospiraceae bacterium]|nr:hypothetical protein [Oscillospiraceae bacterium]